MLLLLLLSELCDDGAIRLSDGNSLYGRIEVCVNTTWGTVCDSNWTDNEASVICNQLGHSQYG